MAHQAYLHLNVPRAAEQGVFPQNAPSCTGSAWRRSQQRSGEKVEPAAGVGAGGARGRGSAGQRREVVVEGGLGARGAGAGAGWLGLKAKAGARSTPCPAFHCSLSPPSCQVSKGTKSKLKIRIFPQRNQLRGMASPRSQQAYRLEPRWLSTTLRV